MSAALPTALRARFQAYIEDGLSGRAAAARLRLSTATGVRWQRKLRETGSVAMEAQGRPPGGGKLAAHQAFLEEVVAQDGDIIPTFDDRASPRACRDLRALIQCGKQIGVCHAYFASY